MSIAPRDKLVRLRVSGEVGDNEFELCRLTAF